LAPFKVRGEWFKISINKINQINHDYWWVDFLPPPRQAGWGIPEET